jgi:glucose/arabinose dehydrogenase
MKPVRYLLGIIFAAGLLAAAALFISRQTAGPPAASPSRTPTPTAKPSSVTYAVKPVVGGLQVPWSLVFPSAQRWLVSERSGAIRIIQNGVLQPNPLVTFNVSSRAEEGLMGLALDPAYPANKIVYACYAYAAAGKLTDRVVRFEDRGTTAGPQTTLIDGIPAAVNHAGCRLGFGPADHKLYITTGDATNKANPQNLASLGGKILRLNSDGTFPADNPFLNSPVWTLGHRNPQGIAWQPGTSQLYATEHGPTSDGPPGGDELNIINKGSNYGWPIISHTATDPRFITPLLIYTPAVAPSGATFYTADVMPQFTNSLLFAALKGEGVYQVKFDPVNPSRIVSQAKLPNVNVGRVRDVVQGPDGGLYILTSNRDGRGTVHDGDDHIYLIHP